MNGISKLLVVLSLSCPSLCHAGGLNDEQQKERPRIRIASAPYPNVLFRNLKRPQFGEHHYSAKLWRAEREVSRGHFYTRRGGFIDLAHLRKTVDWAAWLQARMQKDLEAGHTVLDYTCSEPSRYTLRVRYPEAVERMSRDERSRFQHALSVQLALYTSYTALTWHEILTWYGYSALPGLSEQQSAFSYEDMFTHAVGIAVARRALMDEARDFDAAVSVALDAEIRRLEPMGRDLTRRALEEVKGRWWRYGRTLKRYTEIGIGGPLSPWLVESFPCENPVRYEAPGLHDVAGIDMRGHVQLQLEPRVRVGGKILEILGRENGAIEPAADFPRIMREIRQAVARIEPRS